MRGHADAATLAAFREELLSGRKATQVSAHLAACPRCAALEAQLAEVSTMLSRTTAPPMPAALTARIEAALAAEAAARSATTAPRAAAAAEPVPAMAGAPARVGSPSTNGPDRAGEKTGRQAGWRGHDRSWLALRVAVVTAAVAVIAGGGYGVAQLLTGNPPVNGAATGPPAAPGIKIKGPVPSNGGSIGVPGSASGGGSSHSNVGTIAAPVVSSGTNYRTGSLGAQASAVLKHLKPSLVHPGPALATPKNRAAFSADLQACVIHISNGQHPLLVDLAHYEGRSAVIVVLPGTNGSQPHAVVLAPGCTGTTSQVLATAPLPASG